MRRFSALAAVAATLLIVAPAGTSAQSNGLSEAEAARALFGWSTEAQTISHLRSGADVGTQEWGLAMTEAEEMDLLNPMAVEQSYEAELIPYLRSRPSFGGAWIDQVAGGTLVVVLTSQDAAVQSAVESRLPKVNRGLRFEFGDDTEVELLEAFKRAHDVWTEVGSSAELLGVNVDTAGNRVVFRFTERDVEEGAAAMIEVEGRLGVDVGTRADLPAKDATCSSRVNCYGPLLPGIHIHNGGYSSPIGNICTMGFHITIGGDQQFMTSGHCGIYSSTYNNWFNGGFGFLGNEIANQIDDSVRRDVMRVALLDSEATTLIYGQTGVVAGWGTTMNWQAISVSLGFGSNTVKTGTVTDSSITWTSNTCGCVVYGADASWTTKPGDSGSPVYRVVTNPAPQAPSLFALGVNATEAGHFAEVADALIVWGGGIYQP